MRICIFAHPDAVHTRRMVKALGERGVSVHLVYKGDHQPEGATYERFGVPGPGMGHALRRSIRRERYLAKFFKEHDLVTVFYLSDWGMYDEAVAHGRLALWPWGSDINAPPDAPSETDRLRSRRMEMFRCAHGVATCGRWFAGQVANYAGIEASEVSVLPLGVDLDLFQPAREKSIEPIVGFLKGFGPAYGAERWVRAMPKVVAQVPDVRFDMVGGGSSLLACQQLAQTLGVADRIRWLQPKPHDQVPALLQSWRVSVIPSVVESFGVAALESSACGVPVVASDVGGLPETVLDGETGILTSPGNHAMLADAVVALLKDEDKCAEMGRAGHEFVADQFSWRFCADRWMRFFESIALPAESPSTQTHDCSGLSTSCGA